jgi:hypothetical protein
VKKWKAILLTLALQSAQVLVPQIPNEGMRSLAAATILIINAAAVKKVSETNPDGTPAEVVYIKEKK